MVTGVITVMGVLIAALRDWRVRKIPNALTFTMIAAGFVANGLTGGVAGVVLSAAGLLCGILFLYIPFTLGGVGGGDVKLVGAVGSLLGPYMVLKIFLASAVFGGIFSLAAIISKKAVKRTISSIMNHVMCFYLTRKLTFETGGKDPQQINVPYACAIGCGTLFVLFVLKGGG